MEMKPHEMTNGLSCRGRRSAHFPLRLLAVLLLLSGFHLHGEQGYADSPDFTLNTFDPAYVYAPTFGSADSPLFELNTYERTLVGYGFSGLFTVDTRDVATGTVGAGSERQFQSAP